MKCGVCKQPGQTLDHIKSCSGLTPLDEPDTGAYLRPAESDSPEAFLGLGGRAQPTERQLNYAHALLRERQPYGALADAENTGGPESAHELISSMSYAEIGDYISGLKDQPRRPASQRTKPAGVDEPGMYKVGDEIYKVQQALYGSNHLYAKRLVDYGEGSWEFEYASGAISMLKPENRMSLEEAKAFGALYGTCCVCGRTLTNEKSIEAGIGPVCAGKV